MRDLRVAGTIGFSCDAKLFAIADGCAFSVRLRFPGLIGFGSSNLKQLSTSAHFVEHAFKTVLLHVPR